MLPLFIRKNCRVGINIVMRSFATTPTNKILAHKKKMIYQAQSEEALKLDSTDAKLSEEQQQHRQDHFQEMQF